MKIKLWAATDRLGCNIKPEAHPAIQSRRLTAVVLAAGVAVALNANIDIKFSGVRIATATFAASALVISSPNLWECWLHVLSFDEIPGI